MATSNYKLIDSRIAKGLCRMFTFAYQMGFRDAYDTDDASRCEEFASVVRMPGVFGRVNNDYTCTWREWALELIMVSRKQSFNGAIREYFDAIFKYNIYLSCAYVIAQECYIQGMEDYNASPSRMAVQGIDSHGNCRWIKGRFAKRSYRVFVEDIQMMSFNRERIDAAAIEAGETKYALKGSQYRHFSRSLWAGLRNIVWN